MANSRAIALSGLCLMLAAIACPISAQLLVPPTDGNSCIGFVHGVASGDPTPNSIILWTRFTPADIGTASAANIPVSWYISTQETFTSSNAEKSGQVATSDEQDFTVKVDVTGLQPATRYYYFFQQGNYTSLLGTTKTAPAAGVAVESLRFAQMSCASWRWGFFSVYNMTSRVKDLDFIVFLGDWIYEYGNDYYPDKGKEPEGRAPQQPATECSSLQDYRLRHKQVHTDPMAVEMMRRHPIIAIWDDHEVADNSYEQGSETAIPGVIYTQRICNSVKAYFEYMPIRMPNATDAAATKVPGDDVTVACEKSLDIYRTFQYGNLMTMVVVEERLQYRDVQLNYSATPYIQALEANPPSTWDSIKPELDAKRAQYDAARADPNRVLIGPQVDRIRRDFTASAASKTTWQVFGNTVVMSPLNSPDVETGIKQVYSGVGESILTGLLGVASSSYAANLPGSFGGSTRVLIGTGRFADPVVVDGWCGYLAEREKLLDIMATVAINPVVLSGDIHNGVVWQLLNNKSEPVAIEFTTPSVTAPGIDWLAAKLPTGGLGVPKLLDALQVGLEKSNPTLLYANVRDRGAVFHTVTASNWHADYYYIKDQNSPVVDFQCGVAYDIKAGSAKNATKGTCTTIPNLFYTLNQAGDPIQGATNVGNQPAVPGTTLFTGCQPEKFAGASTKLATGYMLQLLMVAACVMAMWQ